MGTKGILTDPATGDLLIDGGSVAVGDNRAQCAGQIIMSNRGEYKEHPLVGGCLPLMLHGGPSRFWAGRVRGMCAAMGLETGRITAGSDGKITVWL